MGCSRLVADLRLRLLALRHVSTAGSGGFSLCRRRRGGAACRVPRRFAVVAVDPSLTVLIRRPRRLLVVAYLVTDSAHKSSAMPEPNAAANETNEPLGVVPVERSDLRVAALAGHLARRARLGLADHRRRPRGVATRLDGERAVRRRP